MNQLAKELGVESKAILAKCRDEGLGDNVPNHMSVLSIGLAETVRKWFTGNEHPSVLVNAPPLEVLRILAPVPPFVSHQEMAVVAAPSGVPAIRLFVYAISGDQRWHGQQFPSRNHEGTWVTTVHFGFEHSHGEKFALLAIATDEQPMAALTAHELPQGLRSQVIEVQREMLDERQAQTLVAVVRADDGSGNVRRLDFPPPGSMTRDTFETVIQEIAKIELLNGGRLWMLQSKWIQVFKEAHDLAAVIDRRRNKPIEPGGKSPSVVASPLPPPPVAAPAAFEPLTAEGDTDYNGKMRNDFLVQAYKGRGERDAFNPETVGRALGMEKIEAMDIVMSLKAEGLVYMFDSGFSLTDRALREAVRIMRQRGVLAGPKPDSTVRDTHAPPLSHNESAATGGRVIHNYGNYIEGEGDHTLVSDRGRITRPNESTNWFVKALVNRTMAVIGSLIVAAAGLLAWYLKHKG